MNSSQYQQHQQLVVPRSDASTHQVIQPRRQSQQDYRQYEYQDERPRRHSDDHYSHQEKSRRREREERNPLMTVWRETYEVWDGVLEVVGKAWFKMGGK